MKSAKEGISMKTNKNLSWLVFALLIVMFMAARTVLPQTSPSCYFGCGIVQVDGLTAPNKSTCETTVSATVTSGPCGGVDVVANGGSQNCAGQLSCATITYSGGGPALKVVTVTNYCLGNDTYAEYSITVVDPSKLPASVTVTSSGTDKETDASGGNCQDVSIKASKTYTFNPNGSCSSSSCNQNPSFATGNANVGSLDFLLALGQATPHLSAGYLRLKTEVPSLALSQPSSLIPPFPETNVIVITNQSGMIEQVEVPAGLVNVAVVNNYEYQLQCFYNTNVGSINTNGLYTTNGPAFATWIIENPDGASASNRLWIIDESQNRYFEYTYTNQNSRWDLLEPDGSTVVSTWKIANATNSAITNVYRQTTYNGSVVQASQQTWEYVQGLSYLLLLQQIDGNGTATNITTYTYYPPNTGDGSSNQVQRVDYPNGNWEYNTYDGYGRNTTNYSAFENYPPPAAGTAPNPSVNPCKVTSYFYDLDTADDGIDWAPESIPGDPLFPPRKTTVNLPVQNGSNWQLHEVSRNYSFTPQDDQQLLGHPWAAQIQNCVVPGALYNDPNNPNLVTITDQIQSGDWSDGLPTTINRPDGTVINFSYPNEQEADKNDNNYILSTNLVDTWGNPLLYSTADYQTGVILTRDSYIYTNLNGTYLDPLRRTHNEIDLAGRVTQYSYSDCCGLSSVIDPDGILTDYTYDILKRQIASTVYRGSPNGVTSTNILDGMGRVAVAQRIGTDNSMNTLAQFQYDILGRPMLQTNALGGVTTTTNVFISGQQYATNTYADGGTRIEQYYRDGRLESITGTAVRGVQYQYGAEQDSETGNWVAYTLGTKLDTSGNPTSEWTKTYTDSANRQYKTIYAAASTNYPYSESYYDPNGQLWKQRDPDGDITFYTYNSNGQREYTITALSAIALGITSYSALTSSLTTLEQNGIDRISRTERVVVAAANNRPDLVEYDNYVWTNSETDTSGTLISRSQSATTTLTNWNISYRDVNISITNFTTVVPGTSRTNLSMNPDGSWTTSVYSYGQLASVTGYDSQANRISGATYTYDAQGRQYQVTDARNGATTYAYNNADLISSVTTPAPGSGQSAEITSTYYNKMLQATNVVQPDGTSAYSVYLPTGDLGLQYGSRSYPAAYSYDYAGRMKTMTNWSNFSGNSGARVTTWNYDPYRGFLTSKTYDGGMTGPSYTYTPAGRLASRAWARGITTSYSYDAAGGMTNVTYSDGITPGVGYVYDRQGRQTNILVNGMTDTLAYNLAGQLLSESYSGGILNGLSVTNGYDQYLRRTNLTALASGVLNQATYGYDNASRLATVSDGNFGSATYSYVANSPLVSQITFESNGVTRMTTTKQYDYLNRLTQISSAPSASSAISFNYSYNNANQRTQDTLVDGSYWIYQYDSLGQVISGKKYWRDGTPVAGQQFGYTFDTIGNRTQTQSGGDQNGANLRLANYTNNTLNQITSRDVPAYVDIKGVSIATNTVTVNGSTAYRKWEYFRDELPVNNSTMALWTNIIVTATSQTSVTGNLFVAQSPEVFGYDADGNQTNDGRWAYVWDAENRLVHMTSLTNAPVGSKLKLDFAYDSKGRRIQKIISTNNGTAYVPQYTNNYLYDGWNLIAILSPQAAVIQSFTWGNDVSGSLQGAGGVGGLLEMSYYGSATTNCFVACDGNGNVMGLIKAADGALAADYEYGPFGETLRATGQMSKSNPFRWSTKYQDYETDLIYFGYRYYNPSSGKWVNRDPLGEKGGENLYVFAKNDSLGSVDFLGMDSEPINLTLHIGPVTIAHFRGAWIWSCIEGQESSDINMSPGLTGFTGVGVTGHPPGGIDVGVGANISALPDNRSNWKECPCGKKYIVDLTIHFMKTVGIVVTVTWEFDSVSKHVECPCHK
jgi:RHS repeat-associated protein